MRIPSEFNDDNLYRRGQNGCRTGRSFGQSRRLIRLVIGLALVIVVMKQASKASIYRPFFSAPPALVTNSTMPTEGSGGGAATVEARTSKATKSGSQNRGEFRLFSGNQILPEDRSIADELVAQTDPEAQRIWVRDLSRVLEGEPPGDPQSPVANSLANRSSLSEIAGHVDALADRQSGLSNEQIAKWQTAMARLSQSPDAVAPNHDQTSSHETRAIAAALLASLDDAALSRVVDGSVWRSGDFDLFYRLLDQAANESKQRGTNRSATRVGVVPLLQQPDVFRGHPVRVSGTVARAQRLDARDNVFGITEYWQLWLRPDDGADRPIVAIVPTVPPSIARVDEDASLESGPPAELMGTFLKRLAYQSSAGADLAPVIIGVLDVPLESIADTSLPVDTSSLSDSDIRWRLGWTVTLACLIGVAATSLAMWRTTVMTRRSRALRVSGRPSQSEFLKDLETTALSSSKDQLQ
ncbi:hypothetical protein [Rubripirellula reticaptiva]|uniref:Uncharacterized protein n=1 Tax=Rubripirellula reticaptiva TaxID=2528013 RepID=A0A5C6F6C4_9BACT|nr:hypothetical protein [Rubripirellula reticaptiva]TWU56120.1 hypothetical protein Poly59_24240 [Rubripirellula reticaptiva]